MKRYGLKWDDRNTCGCHMTDSDKADYGDYYAVEDVEREMIPRPDAEAARKAVDAVLTEVMWLYEYKYKGHADLIESQQNKVNEARAALLRLMGVEVGP